MPTMAAHRPGRAGERGSQEPTESGSPPILPYTGWLPCSDFSHPHFPQDWRPSWNTSQALRSLLPSPCLPSTYGFFLSLSILPVPPLPSLFLPYLPFHTQKGVGGADTPTPELLEGWTCGTGRAHREAGPRKGHGRGMGPGQMGTAASSRPQEHLGGDWAFSLLHLGKVRPLHVCCCLSLVLGCLHPYRYEHGVPSGVLVSFVGVTQARVT